MMEQGYYQLSEKVIVRKEWFGCLVCVIDSGQFYQYNDDMFQLLRLLQNSHSSEELISALIRSYSVREEEISVLLQGLCKDRIISLQRKRGKARAGRIYFDDRTDFRKDCLVSPVSVTVYITNFCSKACKHCVTLSSPYVDRKGEYGSKEWKNALQKLKESGVCALVFTGGEPLLKKDIFEILEHADALGFVISLLTDYDNITEQQLAKLQSLRNLYDLQTSLDGGTEETHDFTRGKGSFQLAMKRLALLKQMKMRYTISFSASNLNVVELDLVADIAREYNANYLYLNPVAPYGRAKQEMEKYLLDDAQLKWLAQEYLRLIIERKVNPGNPYWIENLDKYGNHEFHPFEGALQAVSIGTYNFSVGSRGECYLDSKMKAENLLYLGNIADTEIADMWYSPKLDALRKFYSPDCFSYISQSCLT